MKVSPSPNFSFLSVDHPDVVLAATMAERLLFTDPSASIGKLRLFGELLARDAASWANVPLYGKEPQAELLRRLSGKGLLDPRPALLFRNLRDSGNAAVHEGGGSAGQALKLLRDAHELALWFQRLFHKAPGFTRPFVPPSDPARETDEIKAELEKLRLVAAERQAEIDAARAALAAAEQKKAEAEERARREAEERAVWEEHARQEEDEKNQTRKAAEAYQARIAELEAKLEAQPEAFQIGEDAATAAGEQVELDEADTRQIIDEQLRRAGWEADTKELTHARGVRPEKGRRLAIAEWPCGKRRADYVLFDGLTALGVIEAKAFAKDVPGVLDQAVAYACSLTLPDGVTTPTGGPFPVGDKRALVPFVFSTNGRAFFRQLNERSGVWFRDLRREALSHPRALDGWYTPRGLAALAARDEAAADARLNESPLAYLKLRKPQEKAVKAAERALFDGRRECLLAMATGTGKTRVAIALAYRLLKAGRFRRVLFLVDRATLGEQAEGAFRSTPIDAMQPFANHYDVLGLDVIVPDKDPSLHIATVQGMVRRVLNPEPGESPPPIDQYDCLIIDECHRGYSLDKGMSDVELSFRDEADYISKYRRVLDHFDAFKVGLTATPATHTRQIFGDPALLYSYRDAVLDGFLVDHEPPVRIETQLARDGVTYARGSTVKHVDAKSGHESDVVLDDDVDIEVEDINRLALIEGFNRAVCDELADRLDLSSLEKTLVFAVNEQHALMLERLLKDSLQKAATKKGTGPVHAMAVKKITGGNTDALGDVRQFKNQDLPRIAVTVDLLTTGVDVPRIRNLVFVRRVKSRILFAQMLGRATRPCDDYDKPTFRVFDAVDIYGALDDKVDMRPVAVRPDIKASQMVSELRLESAEAKRAALDELTGRIQRRRLSADALAQFTQATGGMTPRQLGSHLRTLSPDEAAAWFSAHPLVVGLVDDRKPSPAGIIYDTTTVDRVLEVSEVKAERIPEDYLAQFASFVRDHRARLPALMAVTGAPRALTRKHLAEVAAALEAEGFDEHRIQVAIKATRKIDIAAGLIGFIRQAALGDPLLPFDDRVGRAVDKLVASRPWSDEQKQWLVWLGDALVTEQALDRGLLDEGVLKQESGGFSRLNKLFDGKLEQVMGDLVDEVWKSAG